MLVKFWGVHGSLPRPGPSTLRFGGNTACVEVRFDDRLIIFDAGSGIRDLGEDLLKRNHSCKNIKAHIFFSHLHWDHVQGFPFFAPIFCRGNEFHLYGGSDLNRTVFQLMSDQMSFPNFPVELCELPASLKFHDLVPDKLLRVGRATIRPRKLNHPGGSFGYRLKHNGKLVVYASDTEHVEEMSETILELAEKADLLIFDSMFTPDQYWGRADKIVRREWGHSTWETAVEIAQRAKVKKLVLFHHGNADSVVEETQELAQRRFPETVAAYEGLEIEV